MKAYWKWKRLVYNCKSDRIGVIDFCEVTNEYLLERNAYWKLRCLVSLLGELVSIGIIDFCEVTREDVLEIEMTGLYLGI
jgi:hypothetical protein